MMYVIRIWQGIKPGMNDGNERPFVYAYKEFDEAEQGIQEIFENDLEMFKSDEDMPDPVSYKEYDEGTEYAEIELEDGDKIMYYVAEDAY